MASNDAQEYNIAAIRDQLLGSFTPETFRRLFRYTHNSALRPVLDEFSPGDGLASMIDKTIDYGETRDLLDALLREAQPAAMPAAESTASSLAQAQRLAEQGNLDEAIRLLRRLYRIFPHNEQIEQLLLEVLYTKGVRSFVADYNLPEAQAALEEVLSIDPLYKDANRLLDRVKFPPMPRAEPVPAPAHRRRFPTLPILAGAVIGSLAGVAFSFTLAPGMPAWAAVISVVLGGILGGILGVILVAIAARL